MKLTQVSIYASEPGLHQVVYKLSTPIAYGYDEPEGEAEYVFVSAVSNGWANETFIFPCTEDGTVLDWMELEGSHKQGMDTAKAVRQFEEHYS